MAASRFSSVSALLSLYLYFQFILLQALWRRSSRPTVDSARQVLDVCQAAILPYGGLLGTEAEATPGVVSVTLR